MGRATHFNARGCTEVNARTVQSMNPHAPAQERQHLASCLHTQLPPPRAQIPPFFLAETSVFRLHTLLFMTF